MNEETTIPRLSQNIGYIVGAVVVIIVIGLFFVPSQQNLHTLGPANVGHENIACEDCHRPAIGTIRQQIQANTKYYLGLRKTGADFGHQAVTNQSCLACHSRPNNRHPVHRFNEPRFAEVRQLISPEQCVSCHTEHQGTRITNVTPTFCIHCHQDTAINNDPITVPHQELIEKEDWETCMGCHDYHGNHAMETETVVGRMIKPARVEAYFKQGPSPYSSEKIYQAKEKLNE